MILVSVLISWTFADGITALEVSCTVPRTTANPACPQAIGIKMAPNSATRSPRIQLIAAPFDPFNAPVRADGKQYSLSGKTSDFRPRSQALAREKLIPLPALRCASA